jgi:hypothetical protein
MIKFFSIKPEDHTWKFYIDNKAMIQRMESYRNSVRHLQWNLWPDADITNMAHKNLGDIPAMFIHVKSHQDEGKAKDRLNFDAHMNIMADALATQQRDSMSKPITKVRSKHCMLVIKDRYITRNSKRWLTQKAGEVPIHHYYKEKYGWSQPVFNSISWKLQHKVL